MYSAKTQKIFFVLIFLFLVNFVLLDIKVFLKKEKPAALPAAPEISPAFFPAPPADSRTGSQICPPACLDKIFEATRGAAKPTPLPEKEVKAALPAVKEFYVPLGSGSTKSSEWVELPGAEAVIDSANYPEPDSIIFEAVLRIPTANGKVYAKLYNVTDKHDVWFSEVWTESSSSYRAESGKISLSPGRKLYRVMMKTTMGFEAILDSARLKIILK